MSRTFIVAKSEFLSLVRTKFFIIGLLMAPVLVGTSIAFNVFAAKHIDRDTRAFAVIDGAGAFYPSIEAAAKAHNDKVGTGSDATGPQFAPRSVDLGGKTLDQVKVELSDQVKAKEIFAFVVIPDRIVDAGAKESIEYYTETPSYDTLPTWLEETLGKKVTERRFIPTRTSIPPSSRS